jgi:hypothetical protein
VRIRFILKRSDVQSQRSEPTLTSFQVFFKSFQMLIRDRHPTLLTGALSHCYRLADPGTLGGP